MTYKEYFLPSEWHDQAFVQLTWPHRETDWKPYFDEITTTMTEIAEAVTRHENLVIAAQYPEEVQSALATKLSEEQLSRVTIVPCDTDDTWARDHGAITLLPRVPGNDVRLLDFKFNGWGQKFKAENDNRITRRLHEAGIFDSVYCGHDQLIDFDDFVLEGGSIESDGEGTVFTTAQCLLAPNRNQPLSQQEIEAELKQRLGAERVIWLNHGNLIGDDTDGHIDTTVRVCPENTLLYTRCTDKNDEQYDDFRALEDELLRLTTASGEPYRLWGLPMPCPVCFDGERLPATYANFLIINGAVIVPTYNQPDLDAEACQTIQCAFPDREIIAINSEVIVRQHGSIHCLTMQYPKK